MSPTTEYNIKKIETLECLYQVIGKDRSLFTWDSINFERKSKYNTFGSDGFEIIENKNIVYEYNGEILSAIPNNLSYLVPAIEKSKSILDLEDNWDDEGSPKYNTHTWVAAIQFLLDYAKSLFEDFNIEIDKPKIYPGPNRSIEILWKKDSYRLLINIAENGQDALFYADNKSKDQMSEGSFNVKKYNKYLIPIAIQL